jgi:hypothetical protein
MTIAIRTRRSNSTGSPLHKLGAAITLLVTAAAPTAAATTISTAATTAVPATVASTTTVSTATASALHFRASFIYIEGASADLASVERSDCFVSLFCIGHFHKSETARAAGVPIGHDADAIHLSMRSEQLPQFVFTSVEIQVAHEDIFHANSLKLSYLRASTSAEEQRLVGRAEKPEMANSQMRAKYSRSGI